MDGIGRGRGEAVDPGGLMEFSVVYTDRALNHMSAAFGEVMRDLSAGLCGVYRAERAVIVPGGGTFGMESVARQFGRGAHALVIRNGWFSFRWSQIFEAGGFAREVTVLNARMTGNGPKSPFAPVPVEEAVAAIREARPDLVIAPHVETSAGLILPDDYVSALAAAAREVGALMVLDCIASGCVWVDMEATGVDILVSAPQKGWSSTPSSGLVMLSGRAAARLEETASDSFAMDLKKWASIMSAYLGGGHAYHATMPTDALRALRDTMVEAREIGFDRLAEAQWRLGREVRAVLEAKGCPSVAADGFKAPGVVVSYTDDPDVRAGKAFAAQGMQIAAGVPLQVGEPEGFSTFRVGLFGLDKLLDVDGTVARFAEVAERAL